MEVSTDLKWIKRLKKRKSDMELKHSFRSGCREHQLRAKLTAHSLFYTFAITQLLHFQIHQPLNTFTTSFKC